MARIALIFPPTQAVTVMPPLGLGYLAAVLRAAGHEVDVYDFARRRLRLRELAGVLTARPPAVVGLSIMTPNYLGARDVALVLRRLPVPPIIVIGGAHVSVHAERSLDDFWADYAAVREGEETFPALLERLQAGGDPAGLPVRRETLPDIRSSRPTEANWRRIDSSRSTGRPGCNDSSEPCRSMDRCCNCGGRSGGASVADACDLNTVADNDTAPCVLVAEALLHAAVRPAAPDLDVGDTASAAAVAA